MKTLSIVRKQPSVRSVCLALNRRVHVVLASLKGEPPWGLSEICSSSRWNSSSWYPPSSNGGPSFKGMGRAGGWVRRISCSEEARWIWKTR